jgi:hypothetical protein
MKTAALCVACALGAFVVMHLQLSSQGGSEDEARSAAKQPQAPFPDTLRPATRYEPVPQAAAFKASDDAHPIAILDRVGRLHDWHNRLPLDWIADSVETTELVLIIGPQRKTCIQVQEYPNQPGAPPIRRYRCELDVWLIEAKTGKEIARNRFTTMPRPIAHQEIWDLTEISTPIECATVLDWVRERVGSYAEELLAAK